MRSPGNPDMNYQTDLISEHSSAELTLYARDGQRKYLNTDERSRFFTAAGAADPATRTLCMTLAHTGCRISEALALSVASVQLSAGVISIRTLKKRGRFHVREIPIPPDLLAALDEVHGIRELQQDMAMAVQKRLWPWSRTWAWTRVKAVMAHAGISGLQANPRGLRHSFGVHAVHSGVPLNLVQRWLGHARMLTTAIYANVVGPEEIAIAERMWCEKRNGPVSARQ